MGRIRRGVTVPYAVALRHGRPLAPRIRQIRPGGEALPGMMRGPGNPDRLAAPTNPSV